MGAACQFHLMFTLQKGLCLFLSFCDHAFGFQCPPPPYVSRVLALYKNIDAHD